MNKQPELTEQTRANILEAFWSLYVVKRIDQITVKEVTAKAGYNRGTFYVYFRDLHHCLQEIERAALPRFEELPPMPGTLELTPEFFDSFIRLYKEKFSYYDILLGERGEPGFQRKLIDSIKSTIMKKVTVADKNEKKELDFLLEYIVSGMIGVMRYYFHSRPKGTKGEIMALLYKAMSGDMILRIQRYLN